LVGLNIVRRQMRRMVSGEYVEVNVGLRLNQPAS
jgi:hypothetical protein